MKSLFFSTLLLLTLTNTYSLGNDSLSEMDTVFPAGTYRYANQPDVIQISAKGMVSTNAKVGAKYPISFPRPLYPYASRFKTTGYYRYGACTVALKLDLEFFPDDKLIGVDLTGPTKLIQCTGIGEITVHSEWMKVE